MNNQRFGSVALSITLLSLLATLAGCAHEVPGPATPATAAHPVVDFAVPVERSREASRPARFDLAPVRATRVTMWGSAKR